MSSRATRRFLRSLRSLRFVGLSLLTPLIVASCYHAEIDLKPLLDADTSGTGGNGGQAAVGQGGVPEVAVGGAPEAVAGAAGSPGIDCDDAALDDEQNACLFVAPTKPECSAQVSGDWEHCYDGGCTVCTDDGYLSKFEYYFKWHPCCRPNPTCSVHIYQACNARCPAPTEHDKLPPCSALPSMQH